MGADRSLEHLVGKRVEVYYNLHKKVFSVRMKGIVRAHLPELMLENVNFAVQQAGRRKVLEKTQKNVHAFVRGIFKGVPDNSEQLEKQRRITYNPYNHHAFYDKEVFEKNETFVDVVKVEGQILLKDKEVFELA